MNVRFGAFEVDLEGRRLVCAGVFFFVSAGLALVLPKRALPSPDQPSEAADVAFETGD